MCDTQTFQQVMPSLCIDSKVEKDLPHAEVDSCNASTASDCSDERLTEFDVDDEWQEAELDEQEEENTSSADNFVDEDLLAAIADWVEDDLDEYIADWVEQDLEEYCASVITQRPSKKRVRFAEEISYVEPEDYIVEMVAYLRAERKAKKAYDKQCREYAQQWKVYMEYWQQASTQPSTPAKEEQ
mmetsp:Transcript_45184/g.70500  ORF Transcript_45184/g.70500 Transcript_45184/m.70500 type:complete len:185 (-) Transcript_45184:264-818(-)